MFRNYPYIYCGLCVLKTVAVRWAVASYDSSRGFKDYSFFEETVSVLNIAPTTEKIWCQFSSQTQSAPVPEVAYRREIN
jgi:hypothetical protein